MTAIGSERELVGVARALAGPDAAYTDLERGLIAKSRPAGARLAEAVRALIATGEDPLGDLFCRLRSPEIRRTSGAVYTPAAILRSMVDWAVGQGTPARILDPGCGSGRFILAAAARFPQARLVAIDNDPLALLMLRANASVRDLGERLSLHCADYRALNLPAADGPTLFIGNPPYVRHHCIEADWKTWYAETARKYGLKASKLAGLHIHFFLKTRQLGKAGDFGAFITSAEWLDVNYGSVLRNLLADGLGGTALHVLAAESMPFADAATTGAITCFRIGNRPNRMVVRSVDSTEQLKDLSSGKSVPWATLEKAHRWTAVIRPAAAAAPGHIELGELCRVHRGQVTGGNRIWIAGAYPGELPEAVLFPAVTKARELLGAGSTLRCADHLRRVIDLPYDLDTLDRDDRMRVERFLRWARAQGANESYIASTRRAWWAINLRAPAPILCTYMARRPPAFVRNLCHARHVNIAHGLYPRTPLSDSDLALLAAYLSRHVRTDSGRTYARGLTKFEPKELERILIPRLEELHGISELLDSEATGERRQEGDRDIPPRTSR